MELKYRSNAAAMKAAKGTEAAIHGVAVAASSVGQFTRAYRALLPVYGHALKMQRVAHNLGFESELEALVAHEERRLSAALAATV